MAPKYKLVSYDRRTGEKESTGYGYDFDEAVAGKRYIEQKKPNIRVEIMPDLGDEGSTCSGTVEVIY